MTYRVMWEIDIDADTPQEAAEQALAIQRNPESIATVFSVAEWNAMNGEFVTIDLTPQLDD